jgi:glycogen debranching enzyme
MTKTEEHVLQGANPGGYYQAIWCRDASYILRDWSLTGNITAALRQLYLIWSHQIKPGGEKLVYGRGSPEMKFMSEVAKDDQQRQFAGALPTTIYQAGFAEVYGKDPDIDSTALMISTTARILNRALKKNASNPSYDPASISTTASSNSADYVAGLLLKLGITDPIKAIEYLVPRMHGAVEYLQHRDIDDDGILEQNHNEDWMDTILRAGKIVYSQACWILALKNYAALLATIGRKDEADRIRKLADRAISSCEDRLWSEEDGAYIDVQETHHIGGPYRTLTQDVSLYLVALSEKSRKDNLPDKGEIEPADEEEINQVRKADEDSTAHYSRVSRTLDALKGRTWKDKWPLVTEVELKTTGPWTLKPYEYHNHTYWPWTTGIEMLARSRFDRVDDCNQLLSTLASKSELHMNAFYEWVNPITGKGNGAFPFRTGISAVRVAIIDILNNIRIKISEAEAS